MSKRAVQTSLLLNITVGFLIFSPLAGCVNTAVAAQGGRNQNARLSRFVEANIIATHAYQVLLAKKSEKADAVCFSQGKLSDDQLQNLVAHQRQLLKSEPAAVKEWVLGRSSDFDPAKDLEPILSSGLAVPENAPVNAFADYLRRKVKKADDSQLRAVASLYQTVLEIERDGDLLQEQFAAYINLGLPVYAGQLGLPGSDQALLAGGREITAQTCAAPYETGPAAWQIAGRKVWNWGEKHLHIRDEKVLANELLREREVRALLPRVRKLPAQKIAVIGHSFTMGQHWSSPSSFVPVVIEILRRENPRVEFKQFAAGGLTASRARARFYKDVIAWKPDRVFLVVMTRGEDDFKALDQLGRDFAAAGITAYIFDRLNDPTSVNQATAKRAADVARAAHIEVIEVGAVLDSAPDRGRFVSLDGIHMTEPYHRLMAKQWLKHLAGTRKVEPPGVGVL